jgi:ParB-like chromosome segregation protein Spo0J
MPPDAERRPRREGGAQDDGHDVSTRVTQSAVSGGELAAPWQLFGPLPAEQYEALKADIGRRGVLVPVELDEDGNVLDGHHRVRACAELGITGYPVVVREGLAEAAKTEHVLKLNLLRRHLGPVAWAESFTRLAELRGVRLDRQGRQKAKTDTMAVLAAEAGVSERTARRKLAEARALADHPDLAAQVDSGDLETKRALRITRDRAAAARREKYDAEVRERCRASEASGETVVSDMWTSVRRWLLRKAERTESIPGRSDPGSWHRRILDPGLSLSEYDDYNAKCGWIIRLTPRQVLKDEGAVTAMKQAQALYAEMREGVRERETALQQYIAEQPAEIGAVLRAAAEDAPDRPEILIGRRYLRGGSDIRQMDLRHMSTSGWESPHTGEDCACGGQTPVGCTEGVAPAAVTLVTGG